MKKRLQYLPLPIALDYFRRWAGGVLWHGLIAIGFILYAFKHRHQGGIMIEVAIGIVLNQKQEICLSKRRKHQVYAGFWEFPGGKCLAHEAPYHALVRELYEEIGIKVQKAHLIDTIEHHYDHGAVRLHFYTVESYSGVVHSKRDRRCWVDKHDLDQYRLPEAIADRCLAKNTEIKPRDPLD